MEARLVEECTFLRLVPSLEKVAKALKNDTGHHGILVAVLTVIMSEEGFRLDEKSEREKNEESETLDPDKWKSPETGCYYLRFKHDIELLDCKIIGIPWGDVIVINLCPVKFPNGNITITRSAVFQTLKYVNPYSSDLAGRFINLMELSHRFKDRLTTPMKGEILTNYGVTNASLLGLPIELKMRIIEMLELPELCKISQTCRELRQLTATSRRPVVPLTF